MVLKVRNCEVYQLSIMQTSLRSADVGLHVISVDRYKNRARKVSARLSFCVLLQFFSSVSKCQRRSFHCQTDCFDFPSSPSRVGDQAAGKQKTKTTQFCDGGSRQEHNFRV
jgi:hypothetical protein